MRKASTRFALALVLALGSETMIAGCGGSSAPVPVAPHSGAMFPLPDNKGFFEIRTEGGGRSARGARSKAAKTPFLVFFYQADGVTEMTPPPTDVTVRIGTTEKGTSIALTPQTKGATGGVPFAAPPDNYPDAFRGELTAKINGESVEASFLFR